MSAVTETRWTVPHEVERFRYWHLSWDVAKAWRLVADVEPTDVVSVEQAAKMFGAPTPQAMMPDPEKGLPEVIYVGVGVDTEWALGEQVDLTRPLLVATRPLPGGDHGDLTIVIDGYHRLFRAWHDGVESLPVIVLTAEQEKAVRIS